MIGRSCYRNRTLGKDREGSADKLDILFPTLSGALRTRNHNRFASRSVAVLAVPHRSCSLGASFRLMVAAASSKEKPLLYGLLKLRGREAKVGWIHGWISRTCSPVLWVDLITGRARAVLLLPLVNTPQVPSALAVSWSPKERRRSKKTVYLAARDWDF